MGEGNARTGRLKLGLQIAAACVVVLIGAFAVGSAVAGPFFWYSCSLDGLEAQGASQASILVSSDGTRLGLLGTSGARQPIALRRIRPEMRKAIIDTEDRRFYSNSGIDYVGIMRALKSDVSAGGIAQGGSTIEQQLVRNLYLTPQQSLSRKLTEACLAVQLDKQWSKDRILTAYLNDIYFGQQAYGIEAAAHAYFGVHAKDLTLEQAAMLAGLPQAPSSYDPLSRPDAAKARRAEVLRAMLQAGDSPRLSSSRFDAKTTSNDASAKRDKSSHEPTAVTTAASANSAKAASTSIAVRDPAVMVFEKSQYPAPSSSTSAFGLIHRCR